MRHETIALGKLYLSELNTRKDREAGQEDSSIADLTASVQQRGLLNPLLVRPMPGGRYEVIAGQRRLLLGRADNV
jgi:ParB/RepB/Spo0J family partition protein